jgi:hypothetical protein
MTASRDLGEFRFSPTPQGRDMTQQSSSNIPAWLERRDVQNHYPQFTPQGLNNSAHTGNGPLFVVVGGKAWYRSADIEAYLDARKTTGSGKGALRVRNKPAEKRRSGRPSKMDQWRRQHAAEGVA